jgi:hypothetical protein
VNTSVVRHFLSFRKAYSSKFEISFPVAGQRAA